MDAAIQAFFDATNANENIGVQSHIDVTGFETAGGKITRKQIRG